MSDDKIPKFKGKTIEELKALSFEEFTSLLPSELRRKIKRGFTAQEEVFLKKVRNNEKNIKTHCRDMIVLPEMVGLKIGIHNGKEFVQIHLIEEMVSMRLGQLAPTRRIGVKHAGSGAKKTDVRK